MDLSANVQSVEALRDFRTALIRFREEAVRSMESVELEIRHALDWLGHDQLKHWQQQVRVWEDRVNEAKIELARAQLMKTADGKTPPCDDQKKALQRAKARLAEAEEKVELVKKWTLIVEQEVGEYRAPAQQMNQLLESDMPVALADFDQLIRGLEGYLSEMAAAAGPESVSSMASGSTVRTDKPPPSASEATPER